MKKKYWHIEAIFLTVIDIVTLVFAHFLGLWLRFDLRISMLPSQLLDDFVSLLLVLVGTGLFFLWYSGLVTSVWRMSMQREMLKIIWTVTAIEIVQILLAYSTFGWGMPAMYYVMGCCLTMFAWFFVRLAYRHIRYLHRAPCELHFMTNAKSNWLRMMGLFCKWKLLSAL